MNTGDSSFSSTNSSSLPPGIIPHGANYLAHTPFYIDWRLEWSVSPFQVGGGGISVRARGLCDISRLPIWLVEWTPSNYSCSYCLINLPVSLLDDPLPLPPPPRTIFFFFFFKSRSAKEHTKTEWQDARKNNRDPSKNNWIREHRVPAEKDRLATKILQMWQCWFDGTTQSTKGVPKQFIIFQDLNYALWKVIMSTLL